MSSWVFSVLLVCRGNICRSPIAEQILRARFPSPLFVFSSAGTDAIDGDTMPPEAIQVAEQLGGANPGDHRARELTPAMIEGADLVVAMTRSHRRHIVQLVPRASRFTFTLRELANLLDDFVANSDPVAELSEAEVSFSPNVAEGLRNAIPLLAARRGYSSPSKQDDLDVRDPLGKPLSVFKETGGQISAAIEQATSAMTTINEGLTAKRRYL
jgi:protein-tyrosine phosphatase